MAPAAIPEHVLAFIRERIDTVPELETLLLLSLDPDKCWSAAEVAARVYVREDRAAAILAALQRRRLAGPVEGRPQEYCFRPASDTERRLVAEVDRAYRSNLAAIATFIHDNAPTSVREFARAFDFKKDR
jgi:hypothetical protein